MTPQRTSAETTSAAPGLTAPGDIALLRRIARGDTTALGELYDVHAAGLLRLAQRYFKDPSTAEDVLQDVFMEVWEKAGDYDPERGSVTAWLAVRMRSRCLDRVRKESRRAALVRHAAHEPVPTVAAPLGGDGQRAKDRLAALNTGERKVVEALFFQDLSSSEAADSLKIPIGTVKSRVRSAMEKLRRVLTPRAGRGVR